jgi:hypothetical protein
LNNTIITLYHGSIDEFDMIDVTKGKPNKDFGRGFYTSRTERHAISIAQRNQKIRLERITELGKRMTVAAWIYTYELDPRELDNLSVKEFATADREWAEFVLKNRGGRQLQQAYDIVTGPTANDDTSTVIGAMLLGLYGDPDSSIAMETFLRLIEPTRLPRQTFFKTQRAANLPRLKSRRML